jgi:hypothetical protein
VALGSIQPLTEYQGYLRGKDGRCVGLTSFPLYVPVVKNHGKLNFLEPSGPMYAHTGTSLPLPLLCSDIGCNTDHSEDKLDNLSSVTPGVYGDST